MNLNQTRLLRSNAKLLFSNFLLFFIFCFNIFSFDFTSKDLNFSFDLPEDFILIDTNQINQYQFSSQITPVQLIVTTTGQQLYKNPQHALKDILKKLKGTGEFIDYTWNNSPSTIAQINLYFNPSAEYCGWAFCTELPSAQNYIVAIGFYPANISEKDKSKANLCDSLIMSAIDSFSSNINAEFIIGPVTTFVYPEGNDFNTSLQINNHSIETTLNDIDFYANQYIVDREHNILYEENKEGFGIEECKRFYRLVYKDAGKRLKQTSFDIANSLMFGENRIKDKNDIPQILLSWVQDFEYKRDLTGSDFVSLPLLITEKQGDCDSRALLLAVLLKQMNFDTTIFISKEFSHALLGIALDKNGAKITADEKVYLLGETTAHVALGQIHKDMNNPAYWFNVKLSK